MRMIRQILTKLNKRPHPNSPIGIPLGHGAFEI